MIKKIKKSECDELHEDLWDYITDDWVHEEREHRKYASFFIDAFFSIQESDIKFYVEEFAEDNPDLAKKIEDFLRDRIEYWGISGIWDDSNGTEWDQDYLTKAKKITRTVQVEEWVYE
jgi:hypothetical protein